MAHATINTLGVWLANLVTLPYYRSYRENTLSPILSIVKSVRENENQDKIKEQFRQWVDRKIHEFQLVAVGSTLLAAAIVACFSWPVRETQHWIGPAAWYSGLISSITGVFLSSTMTFIFISIKNSPTGRDLTKDLTIFAHVRDLDEEAGPAEQNTTVTTNSTNRRPAQVRRPARISVNYNMVFTWQAPMGLMAYSAIGFIIGLMVYVTTPLYDGSAFGGDSKAAITFLVFCAAAAGVFVWCAYWSYKYTQLNAGYKYG